MDVIFLFVNNLENGMKRHLLITILIFSFTGSATVVLAQEDPLMKALADLSACKLSALKSCRAYKQVVESVTPDKTLLGTLAAHEAATVQLTALHIMGRQGPDLAALRILLGSTHDLVKLEAVGLVANTGSGELAEPVLRLTEQAYKDKHERMLLKGIFALGRLRHEPSTSFLLELAGDSVQKVSRAAIEAVARIGGELVVERLVADAKNKEQTRQRRLTAINNLGYLKAPEATKVLIEYTRIKDEEFRRAALRGLAESGDRRAVGQLVDLHNDPAVRADLIRTLGRLGGEKAGGLLMTFARDETIDAKLRLEALAAAARTGAVKALPLLEEKLKDRDSKVRRVALESLGHLGNKDATISLYAVYKKASGKEKSLAHWAIKRCTGKALETDEQIKDYVEALKK
jgi:HEAT repeat protein